MEARSPHWQQSLVPLLLSRLQQLMTLRVLPSFYKSTRDVEHKLRGRIGVNESAARCGSFVRVPL